MTEYTYEDLHRILSEVRAKLEPVCPEEVPFERLPALAQRIHDRGLDSYNLLQDIRGTLR